MSSPGRVPSNRPEEIPPERIAIVDGARRSWIKKLIDLSRRNNLLFYRQLKTGILDLSIAIDEKMAELLSGQSVSLNKLLESAWKTEINDVVREIRRRALTNIEERGLIQGGRECLRSREIANRCFDFTRKPTGFGSAAH